MRLLAEFLLDIRRFTNKNYYYYYYVIITVRDLIDNLKHNAYVGSGARVHERVRVCDVNEYAHLPTARVGRILPSRTTTTQDTA